MLTFVSILDTYIQEILLFSIYYVLTFIGSVLLLNDMTDDQSTLDRHSSLRKLVIIYHRKFKAPV